ncbi:MAG: hypothetical protein L3K04_05535 [Thermoplasmata archaeon]|nr:hypothetical protein [Thermoplasmata archaeon]
MPLAARPQVRAGCIALVALLLLGGMGLGAAVHVTGRAVTAPQGHAGDERHSGSSVPAGPLPSLWVRLSVAGGPFNNLSGFAVAYDAADGYDVLFGGYNISTFMPVNGTYIYHQAKWTQLLPSASPPAVSNPSLAYDPQTRSVILFGGQTQFGVVGQTWSFSNGSWTQLTPHPSPGGRQGAALVYDAADGYLVLFGGSDPTYPYVNYTDTWSFNSKENWTNLSTSGSAPRCSSGAADYDPTTGKVYAFSGMYYDVSAYELDCPATTWEYSAGTWTNLTTSTAPGPRSFAAFAFDPALGASILYGGTNFSSFGSVYTDLWELDAGAWSKLASTAAPNSQPDSQLVYDPGSQLLLVVQGVPNTGASTATPDVWLFDDFSPGHIVANPPSGTGEAGSPVNFTLTGAAPLPGASYNWTGVAGCTSVDAPTWNCLIPGSGNYSVAVNVTNRYDLLRSAAPVGYEVLPALRTPTASLAPASIDLNQSVTLTTTDTGGAPPYQYNWSGLPPGCSGLGMASLTCAPTMSGIYSTIRSSVVDHLGIMRSSAPLTLTVFGPLALQPITVRPALVDVGRPAVISITAHGGSGAYSYNWTGLPPGCVGAGSSAFTCSSTGTGTFPFSVVVTDTLGGSAQAQAQIVVAPLPSVTVGLSSANLDLGQTLTLTATGSGGVGGFNYSFQNLPPGCSAGTHPVVICTPTTPGAYSLVVRATDAEGVAGQSTPVALTVAPELSLTARLSAPIVSLGSAVGITLEASGGTGPFAFTYQGLPPGCPVSNSSQLMCTPNATGNFTVVGQVRDGAGVTVSHTFYVVVTRHSSPAMASEMLLIGVVAGVVVLAALASLLLLRRRRSKDEDWGEPLEEPAPPEPAPADR